MIRLTINSRAIPSPVVARGIAFMLSEKLSKRMPGEVIEIGVKDTGSADSVVLHNNDVLYSAADFAEDMQ